ncbi:MAG: exodeoxyribonuclease V subunit gamma [Candidatus Hydrogenedentes bacterium]|nr:exodeoxyribonuclease V subunit gamma [Candidatus Hydrogenedentota bacterium]
MSEAVLHTGSPSSDRSARVLAAVNGAWGEAFLIVPDRRLARTRQRELLEMGQRAGTWGPAAFSFTDFAEALLRQEGMPVYRIEGYTRLLLVQRCLQSCGAHMEALGIDPQRQASGLASHLVQVITSLKQAAVTPEEFSARAAAGEGAAPMDTLVAAVYAAYQNRLLQAGGYDVPGLYWGAHLLCAEKRPALLNGIRLVAFDGFDDFTRSEFRLLEAVAAHMPHVVFGINYDADPDRQDVYRSVAPAIAYIGKRFSVRPTSASEPAITTCTAFAAAHLYWRNEPLPAWDTLDANLAVTPCTDQQHEIETVGRHIRRLITEEHVLPGAIAVTCRNVGPLYNPLTALFREYGIPLQFEGEIGVAQTQAGLFVQRFFQALETWEAPIVLSVLQSPLLGGKPMNHRHFPLLVRLAKIHRGQEAWSGRLAWLEAALAENGGKELGKQAEQLPDLAGAVAALRTAVAQLGAWGAALECGGTPQALAKRFDEILCEMGIAAALDALDPTTRAMETAALQTLRHVLVQIAQELDAEEPVPLSQFVPWVVRGLHATGVRPGGDRGGVILCDPTGLKNRKVDHVLYLGLNEGIAPQRAPGNAVYTEYDVRRLEGLGVGLEGRHVHHARERLLFHHVLHSARTALHLSWRYLAEDGRDASPSALLTDLYAVIPASRLVQGAVPPTDAIVPQVTEAASVRECRNALYYRFPREAPAVEALGARCAHGFAVEQERQSADPPGAHDGVLADEGLIANLAEHYGAAHRFSVAQLESYGDCPYQFWKERILRVREEEVDEFRLNPMERGAIIHEILQRFHSAHAGQPATEIPARQGLEILQRFVAEVFARRRAARLGVLPAVLFAEEAHTQRQLARYFQIAREQSGPPWAPVYFETAFGMDESSDPLEVPGPDGPIQFTGRIDRADTAGGELRLVDYKSGSPPKGPEIQRGDSLQLTVYAWAAAQLWPEQPCVSACFLEVGKTTLVEAIDSKKDNGREENARAAIARSVAGIRRGYFPPTPREDACYGCGRYHDCRHEAVRIERKTGMKQDENE